ncbi:MAG: tRNA pseudouridine(13) synthase TruD [Planctomycetes bacterium]|nr:tRNA pseudouridine(13) synthase TruD [Planctomycetota bacterium]
MSDPFSLPYLTTDLPGVGGAIKLRPEDFRVVELPLYEPSGEGTHTYFGLRKRGLPTRTAIERVARAVGRRAADFGAAGLKDAQAVTEQTVSVEHLTETQREALQDFQDDAVQVVWVSCHSNKLKMGHLAGNRFDLRIRGVGRDALPAAQAIADELRRRGVPNYFGEQRFGNRGDNWRLGAAAVGGRLEEFVHLLLGEPRDEDPPRIRAARKSFESGQLEEACRGWPRSSRDECNALRALIRTGGAAKAGFAAVGKFHKRFVISSLQSHLFNRVVAQRIGGIDTVFQGDLAKKADTGGVFTVEDEVVERARAVRGEISPTGPLFGYRVELASGEPGRIERAVLAEAGLVAEDWRRAGAHKVKGTRRALRFLAADLDVTADRDDAGPCLRVQFTAPPGSYATVLLREIMKNGNSND